jgi:hypothetical protein
VGWSKSAFEKPFHITLCRSRDGAALVGSLRIRIRETDSRRSHRPKGDKRQELKSSRADAAQREAFDRILGNHMLYCTVCDNNNGNCTVHNTTNKYIALSLPS